jgi:hypothetical protein
LKEGDLAENADYDTTLQVATERERTHPPDAVAYWREGATRHKKEDWKGSRRAFQRFSDLSPDMMADAQLYLEKAQEKTDRTKSQSKGAMRRGAEAMPGA